MESPIIQPTELLELNPEEFILFDASAGSKTRYEESHLNGAFFIDVNTELANIADFSVGGRHPLPTLEQFATVLQKFGVTKNSHIIVYDDKNAANAAARFWWMLKAIGHQKVQVLNGGFNAAIEAGCVTNSAIPTAYKVDAYMMDNWNLPLADINEVEEASKAGSQTIVDVRDANRYAGLTEPIDLIAGHIPNAINIPFTENLDENGFFLAPEMLKQKYQAAFGKVTTENIIIHCGSGITACHTLLAMNYANLQIPKLYVGSWSEWSRNEKEMVLAPKS